MAKTIATVRKAKPGKSKGVKPKDKKKEKPKKEKKDRKLKKDKKDKKEKKGNSSDASLLELQNHLALVHQQLALLQESKPKKRVRRDSVSSDSSSDSDSDASDSSGSSSSSSSSSDSEPEREVPVSARGTAFVPVPAPAPAPVRHSVHAEFDEEEFGEQLPPNAVPISAPVAPVAKPAAHSMPPPAYSTAPGPRPPLVGVPRPPGARPLKKVKTGRICAFCQITETPTWRSGPHGSGTLCNACGTKWKAGRLVEGPDGSLRLVDTPTTLARKAAQENGVKKPRTKKAVTSMMVYTISYEQKRELSTAIEGLAETDPTRLATAVEIIRRGMPAIGNSDEIELDMDLMDERTLLELWRFVKGTDPWAMQSALTVAVPNGSGHGFVDGYAESY